MIVITSNTKTVEVEVTTGSVNDTKKMTVWKSDVVKLRLVDNPTTLDLVEIHYVNNDIDELHFSLITSIDGVAVTSNEDLYDKLKTIFSA